MKEANQYNREKERIFCIDPYHFGIAVHPHAHLKELLETISTNNSWKGQLHETLWNWKAVAPTLFEFQSGRPTMPPIMLLHMDNIEWYPSHRNWGFYSNYNG